MKTGALAGACVLLTAQLFADPKVQVDPGGVPATGTVATDYSGRVTASKGKPPYTFTLVSEALPPGLSLSSAGNITGTPTTAGTFGFTIKVTDREGDSATRIFVVRILPATAPLTITTISPLPNGTVGTPYGQSLGASGGTPPYRWSGAAPPGLLLSADGSIAGMPVTAGAFNFTATVTDSASRTASRNFAINISPPSLTIATNAQLPDATVGTPYSQPLVASGGTPPYRWSGAVPPGLSLSADGWLTGTPSTAGAFNFTATVTDNAARAASRSLAINIRAPSLSITTASPLPNGAVGVFYSQTLAASGGTPPYWWYGLPPQGLTLAANGLLSGTPAALGTFNFTIVVSDTSFGSANRTFSLTINPPSLTLSTGALPSGSIGTGYSQQLSAAGGVPPLSWSLGGGQLPTGLTVNSATGLITGVPTSPGTFSFVIQVRDNTGTIVSNTLAITVNPGPSAPGALTIVTPVLPDGTAGMPYNSGLTASGGASPYSWSIASGSPPTGVTLSPQTGVLSGTPGTPGSYTFAALVRDARGSTDTKQFSVTITRSLTITTATLPNLVFGADSQIAMSADGGVPPYHWALTGGILPDGLGVDPATGLIAGNPRTLGQFSFVAQVSDAAGAIFSRPFTLNVAPPTTPALMVASVPEAISAAQQVLVDLKLDSFYPIAIEGQISIRFVPDPAIGLDDPAVQFSSGGRTVAFTIPANSMQPVSPIAFQTGSVAGTIELQILPNSAPPLSRSINIMRSPPMIRNLTAVRSATGVELRMTGLSPSRELTRATVRWAGTGLETTEVNVPLDSVSVAWYRSSASAQFGSQFSLILPFTIQGDFNTIQSATVTLSNSEGASSPLSAPMAF